ncbi:MAG: DUF3016 domain-containing protein [Gammaproteobacteria bacterium]
MNPRYFPFALVLLSAPALAADVTVQFTNPDHYTDARLENSSLPAAQASLEKNLRSYFEQLTKRFVPGDRKLTIEVLDIDLAGRFEPWRADADTVRFMVTTSWPSMKLRYALTDAGGRTVASGEELVSDPEYLRIPNMYPEGDVLRYEKPMLEKWFREKFGRFTS